MQHLMSANYFCDTFPLFVSPARHGMVASHYHDFFELVYVISGSGMHAIGNASYPIHAGDIYAISPNEPHAYYPIDGQQLNIINILFKPEILDDSLLNSGAQIGLTGLLYLEPLFRIESSFAHRLNVQGVLAYRIEQLLNEMQNEQNERLPGYELVLKNTFCNLLILISRAYEKQLQKSGVNSEFSRRHAVVEAAMRYIEAHHTEAVSLADVAQHTAMSASRLAHLFKQHTRRSLIAYLHEYRINRVSADLLQSDAPVSELAKRLGYSDLRFFYRIFRRYRACSPTEYRQRFRPSHVTT